jgi:heme A synthase
MSPSGVAPGREGDGQALARFRRLAGVTIVATLALILIGGVVRVSDSGLGCGPEGSGAHGWPLCEGRALPALETNAVVEFSHRIAATIVAVLIVALVVVAWRRLRARRSLVRLSLAAGVLVLVQAALGGLTVESGLHEYAVAAHLGLAMLLLGVLIALRRLATPEQEPLSAPSLLRRLTFVSLGLVLATIVAGGLVAGTEGEGTASEPVLGAHLACGEQFPGCIGEFMPFGTDRLVDIQLTHRLLMYLTAISVLATFAVALRRRVALRAYGLWVGLLAAQILLGALNVWLGKHPGLIIGHLALGTSIFGVAAWTAAALRPAAEPLGDSVRAREPEAVTA